MSEKDTPFPSAELLLSRMLGRLAEVSTTTKIPYWSILPHMKPSEIERRCRGKNDFLKDLARRLGAADPSALTFRDNVLLTQQEPGWRLDTESRADLIVQSAKAPRSSN